MCSVVYLMSIFVIIWQPTYCFYNLCDTPENTILNDEECTDIYFETSEKATSLGRLKLQLEGNSIKVTPEASSWTTTFLRITMQNNTTNQFCSKLTQEEQFKSYCFIFRPEIENETILLEYKIQKLPEISSRKLLFSVPNWKHMPLFLYIDQTDTSRLVLQAQKLPSLANTTYYKVEAYKEKNGNTNLQDTMFSSSEEIYYELFTYNDVGNYYFVVWVMNDKCINNLCLKMSTPKVFIGRKSTRVVIGIVGASFILPFVLFIFHILTKKYPEEHQLDSVERLVVAYKSSSKKHNEVVTTLAALLEQLGTKRLIVDVIDLSKNTKKFAEKFCIDSVIVANRVVYVSPPKHDLNPISLYKSLCEKEFFGVIFEHCAETLPQFIESNKSFKLFEDFDKFINALNISGSYDTPLYQDLHRKTEEAKVESDRCLNAEILPKIVITDSEPQESDSLISAKVDL